MEFTMQTVIVIVLEHCSVQCRVPIAMVEYGML